ncbi:flavin reductase family protein [Bacillus sp. FJAT-22090]|uniref:flavin reductase family protein n=1 Tax=Bacillus sp. FJAT-22090 TaxID=1581038 RepID=UPI0021B365CF|nr:flavin reductase family protein [Bacillus sp. FJAT-22090]
MIRQPDREIDERIYRDVMGSFATGVTVITTKVDEAVYGMTANAFMSVSLKPKLVAISIGEKANMLQHINKSKQFAINILSSNQQNVSKQFSGQLDTEASILFSTYKGLPILEQSLAVITCELHSQYVVGDHTIFIGLVTGVKLEPKDPLLFSQGKYRELSEKES